MALTKEENKLEHVQAHIFHVLILLLELSLEQCGKCLLGSVCDYSQKTEVRCAMDSACAKNLQSEVKNKMTIISKDRSNWRWCQSEPSQLFFFLSPNEWELRLFSEAERRRNFFPIQIWCCGTNANSRLVYYLVFQLWTCRQVVSNYAFP